ncbi:MAG TPA: beta-ketoacyl synthase N-terminal-like domain-containing protein [Candidatus Limnocylindrales bacterium]|nr:beta-ketoacyl synthase N-terminal-like domain-containing protein [Candidatus Limnocylindrales bacterium]
MALPSIVGWSALSPWGSGRREFIEGLSEPDSGRLRPLPGWDELAAAMGGQGTRTLDRMTLMVIATSGAVLSEHAARLGDAAGSVGLVVGTSMGCVNSTVSFIRDTFVHAKPYFVEPMLFPNTVMNGAAGHTAIWHGLRGLNSTIAAGHLTGLAAIRYGTRMIRHGYARRLLVGCVEESSAPVMAAARALRRSSVDGLPPLGEGCVMFLLDGEPQGCGLGEVVDFETGVALGSAEERLAGCLRDLLPRNGVAPAEPWLVSLAHGEGTPLGAIERAAVSAVVPGVRQIAVADRLGDCFSAQGAFQLAAVLALAERESRTGPALITSVGADGAVGAALVRT